VFKEWAKRFTDEQKENHRRHTKLKRFVEVDVRVSASAVGRFVFCTNYEPCRMSRSKSSD
jgi:hypothetical protein